MDPPVRYEVRRFAPVVLSPDTRHPAILMVSLELGRATPTSTRVSAKLRICRCVLSRHISSHGGSLLWFHMKPFLDLVRENKFVDF
jgi:hypothetical protein